MNNQLQKLELLLSENALEIVDFANCIGVSESLVVSWHSGNKKISKSQARQIEQTFSKPPFWFDEVSEGGPNYDLFG